jgi:ribonucleoside-diphosphate reductase alpha chain
MTKPIDLLFILYVTTTIFHSFLAIITLIWLEIKILIMCIMKIVKRDGRVQDVSFDKIVTRIKKLSLDDNLGHIQNIDCDVVSQKVIQQIYDGISTMELDVIASDICIAMSIDNYQYGLLASRISTSNLHKSTPCSFSECVNILNKGGILNERFVEDVMKNKEFLDSKIVSNRDYLFDFFGFATLTKSYLLRVSDKIIERPQYMWMRVAIALHGDDLEKVVETYENLSELNFIHATPTLFNAGTKREQLSSCFLVDVKGDSVDGIFETMGDVAKISKHAGGIGLTCSRVRAKNSIIRGTNGKSDGILPMLKVYNEISRYINQAGKRNGSFAMFLETHHADIEEFLELKKNTGDVNLRARDLFYGLWVSDLFMKRVEEDGYWYLMCPDECPGLVDAYSTEFEELYNNYVEKGVYRKKMKARDLWEAILVSQTETGTPYMGYKDATNTKNNQSNLGTITSSNLCMEITLFHDKDEYAVCNISSLCLGNCVKNGVFDFGHLAKMSKIATYNLNKVIDLNYYPTPECERSNTRHRPIAIGVQGLYDAFIKLGYAFTSNEAKALNKQIFECIQYNALEESCRLAELYGAYSSFDGSPSSKGMFQHNLWGIDETKLNYDWPALRKKVLQFGLRNSTLTALPPTASTANIMGNVSSFETITSNIFTRTVLSGNFPIINKYLVKELNDRGLWSTQVKDSIISSNGSVQGISSIPHDIKELYKTTWETSQKETINMSADRAPFIDQSQSLNIFMASPTTAKLSSMHFHGWKKGLKLSSYYIRSQPISTAEQITVTQQTTQEEILACSLENPESCMMCE